jgi:hypothetical protein
MQGNTVGLETVEAPMDISVVRRSCRVGLIVLAGMLVSIPALAQTRAEGLIHHYTEDVDGNGPWQIVGEWSLTLRPNGTVDLVTALSMARAENPNRSPHTHHVSMPGGQVSPIANGFRISGTAMIANNGNVSPFSNSPVTVDIIGGNSVGFSNVSVTFGGAAAAHFGVEPVRGVVRVE